MRLSEQQRILYFITSDLSARFLRGQLAFLIQQGVEVHVGLHVASTANDLDDGVKIHPLPFSREPSPTQDLRTLIDAVRTVRAVKPAIVNASTPKAGLIGMLAARVCRVPRRVYVVRGLRFETMTGCRRRAFRCLERVATSCATDVVYNSPSLRSTAEREHCVAAGRGVVLGGGSGNGIDPSRFGDPPSREQARRELGLPPDSIVIGFVGRLTRDKGLPDLIDSLDDLPDNAMLLIVGSPEEGDPLPERTRAVLDSSPRIKRFSWSEEVSRFYPAMDVLAFPSYREGLPNVPLESQLHGVPIVGYAATGTVDAVQRSEANELVPVGDRIGLSRALVHRLANPPSAATRQLLREWVIERFDQTRIWNDLLSVYAGSFRPPSEQNEPSAPAGYT